MKFDIGNRIVALFVTLALILSIPVGASALNISDSDGRQDTHLHGESCFEKILLCGEEETERHFHQEECYEKKLVCQLAEDSLEPVISEEESVEGGLSARETSSAETEEAEIRRSGLGAAVVESDGLNFTCTIYDDNTAILTDISEPVSPQPVSVPENINYEGQRYTITGCSFSAFGASVQNITEIVLPGTLTEAGGYFKHFSDLERITIPGTVKIFTGNFQSCKKLSEITFAEGVEEIACNSMTLDCTALKTVRLPSTLKTISQNHTFSGASALENINLPEGVKLENISTFNQCTSLKTIELPESVTSIPQSTFDGCTSLESVAARGRLTGIGKYAFRGCSSLKTIPDLSNVAEMGSYAFYKCKNLEENVDLSALTEVPEYAFYAVPIPSVKFGGGLTSIGEYAFWNAGITELNFPEYLQSIGGHAFEYCYYLYYQPDEIIRIPDSVVSVGEKVFHGTWAQEFCIGSGITEIPAGAFSENEYLRKITIDNAEDNVVIAEGAISTGIEGEDVEIVWLKESIGDVGDRISDEEDAPTLQEAVNRASEGKPAAIEISKDIKLDKVLTIPEGKEIVLSSKGGEENYTILGNKSEELSDLIYVEKDAAITFQDVTLSGIYNSGSVIRSEGQVSVSDGTVVTGSNIQQADGGTGVIENTGSAAYFHMNGGRIEGNTIAARFSGTIRITGGARGSIEGGTIQNNRVIITDHYASSPGIMLYEEGFCEMSGGTIRENSAVRGSAVMLYSLSTDKKANFTLSESALITENICVKPNRSIDASGAVAVEGNSAFHMTGGSIEKNTGEKGVGVCVLDHGLLTGSGEFKTSFVMDGGRISENQGLTGGGIYSYSNEVYLNKGVISSNTANMGGGVYCEGNRTSYSTLHLKNAVVTQNHSEDQGGGLWLCSTGDAKVYVTNGGAVYGNTADGAGDDVVSVEAYDGMDSSITLSDRILGGGRVYWYQDGGIYRISPSLIYASTDTNAARYGEEISEPLEIKGLQTNLALKAIADPSVTALAGSRAKLLITGNTAVSYGGGIGSNGGVVIGEDTAELIDIPVKKIWEHGDNEEVLRPDSITVKLMCGDTVMDELILDRSTADADGNWNGIFKDLLPGLDYYIIEESVPGYSPSIEGDQQSGFTITNSYRPMSGGLSVSKIVTGSSGSRSKEFTFTVKLSDETVNGMYGEMEFKNGVSVFQLKHGESKAADGLPVGVVYTVEESDNSGYTVTSQNHTGSIPEDETAEVTFWNHRGGNSGGSDNTGITVKKVWKLDDGGTAADSVTAALLRDGVVYDTVVLNEENHWTHTWKNLSDRYDWKVTEMNVPDGFTVSVDQLGDLFIITNDDLPADTENPPVDPEDPENPPINPEDPENPSVNPNDPENPSGDPDDPNNNDKSDPPDGQKLPQTGQLWWPAIVSATVGAILLLLESPRLRKYKKKNEK